MVATVFSSKKNVAAAEEEEKRCVYLLSNWIILWVAALFGCNTNFNRQLFSWKHQHCAAHQACSSAKYDVYYCSRHVTGFRLKPSHPVVYNCHDKNIRLFVHRCVVSAYKGASHHRFRKLTLQHFVRHHMSTGVVSAAALAMSLIILRWCKRSDSHKKPAWYQCLCCCALIPPSSPPPQKKHSLFVNKN